MLQFNGQLQLLELDEAKFKKTLKEALQTQLRQAAREWLRAVIPAVPVYTGMARATLSPLGRLLRVSIPIHPVAVRNDKSPSLGESKSSFNFDTSSNVFSFTWNNDVLHYLINEFNDVSKSIPLKNPTPWNSIEKGNIAFHKYVEEVLPTKLPKMAEFIKAKTATVR